MMKWRTALFFYDVRLTMRTAAIACAPGLLLVGLFVVLMLSEWHKIGVIADPGVIAQYDFGSECMVGAGGDNYRSAEEYARSALHEGLWGLPFLAAFTVALYKRYLRIVVLAYLATALIAITKYFI